MEKIHFYKYYILSFMYVSCRKHKKKGPTDTLYTPPDGKGNILKKLIYLMQFPRERTELQQSRCIFRNIPITFTSSTIFSDNVYKCFVCFFQLYSLKQPQAIGGISFGNTYFTITTLHKITKIEFGAIETQEFLLR